MNTTPCFTTKTSRRIMSNLVGGKNLLDPEQLLIPIIFSLFATTIWVAVTDQGMWFSCFSITVEDLHRIMVKVETGLAQ